MIQYQTLWTHCIEKIKLNTYLKINPEFEKTITTNQKKVWSEWFKKLQVLFKDPEKDQIKPRSELQPSTQKQIQQNQSKQTLPSFREQLQIQAEKLDRALKTQDIEQLKEYLQPKDLSFKAGFVGHSYNIWAQWTTDSEIPETITGFPIPLKSESPVVNCVQHPFSSNEAEFTDTELNSLLQKRVIEVTAHKPGIFISPIFVRPESDGGYRLVLNLKKTKSNCRIKKIKNGNNFHNPIFDQTWCLYGQIRHQWCILLHSYFRGTPEIIKIQI